MSDIGTVTTDDPLYKKYNTSLHYKRLSDRLALSRNII